VLFLFENKDNFITFVYLIERNIFSYHSLASWKNDTFIFSSKVSYHKMSRFIRFEYTGKAFQSIDDYKNHPVLPLSSALTPVLSHVDHLDYFIKKAKKYCHYPSEYDLNKDESAAVYLYTDDWGDQSLNRILNRTLQSDDRTTLTPWLGFLKLFFNALEKLPTIKGTIWRGLPIDVTEKLKENQELVLSGITSCSSAVSIITHFLKNNSVLCSIESLDGKDVGDYTPYNNDDEVILLPGTRLHVTSMKSNTEKTEVAICFEEISRIDFDQLALDDSEIHDGSKSIQEEDMSKVNHTETTSTTVSKEIDNESIPSTYDYMKIL
jgi:hypothetical protein